ncbi:PREDICTED: transmembrane protein 150B [Miniopterus natalensis]|uniref:transmembrane protein 150B n=1 Tax=Miniopterus natalensis TaxID=291302 RepID=UPI0007A71B48|nr:PREDICTED: transmembrane protein 150B [Miniopterus natalensis]
MRGFLCLLPAFLALWATSSIWTVFAIAVANQTVNLTEGIPYISLCGSYPPQSCIFSQLLNMGAAMGNCPRPPSRAGPPSDQEPGHTGLAGTRDFHAHSHRADNSQCTVINVINKPVTGHGSCQSLSMGLVRALSPPGGPGLSTGLPLNSPCSSLQQKNQQATHLTGAFFALFVGHIYFWLQLLLSWRMKSLPQPGAPWIGPLRLALCSICSVLMVAMVVLHTSLLRSHSAVCEWAVAMLLFMLFGLLTVDFSSLEGCTLCLRPGPSLNLQPASPISLQVPPSQAL